MLLNPASSVAEALRLHHAARAGKFRLEKSLRWMHGDPLGQTNPASNSRPGSKRATASFFEVDLRAESLDKNLSTVPKWHLDFWFHFIFHFMGKLL